MISKTKRKHTGKVDDVVVELVGEQRLRQFPQERLQNHSGQVDILHFSEVHRLAYTTGDAHYYVKFEGKKKGGYITPRSFPHSTWTGSEKRKRLNICACAEMASGCRPTRVVFELHFLHQGHVGRAPEDPLDLQT